MNQTVKRGLALLMAFVLCIGLMPAIELTANAANVDYRNSGSYIYNWGTPLTSAGGKRLDAPSNSSLNKI